ncbi:MAG: FG-GAP-like repeat-containing protein [Phycisphaerales bacterium]
MHPRTIRLNLPAISMLAAAALIAPLSAANAQCVTSFTVAAPTGSAANAWRISTGDFNGDGKIDLVYTYPGSQSRVTVQLGVGNGTFGSPVDLGAGNAPTHVAVADMNADGKLDLVIANNGSPFCSLRYGNGDGTFAAPLTIQVGNAYHLAAIADVTGDGRPDIVLGSTSGSVQIVINNGNGTFGLGANPLLFPSGSVYALETGDFNGDGRPDIVAANSAGSVVAVLLNVGSGNFASAVNYTVGNNPASVLVRDVNADGKLDLITANAGSSNVSIVLGNGNGTFASPVNYATGMGATSLVYADFNGDGRPDLAVRNLSTGAPVISVLPGLAGGGFGAAANFALPSIGDTANNIVAGDFNGDGKPDLAAVMFGNSLQPCWVYLNNSVAPAMPVITQQPIGRVAAVGTFVELTTTVNTFGATATYAWKKNGAPMSDGDIIWGTVTPTLTISSLSADDTGSYQLHVSVPSCDGTQNVVTTMPAVIAVTVPPTPVVPPNDNCASPQPLSGNGTFTFSTANAGNDGPAENNLGFCCNDPQIHKDVWFIYTATCTGVATFNLCGSGFDTKIAIYAGTSCPTGANTAIAGNDDNGICTPAGDRSVVSFNVIAGRQYLVRVGGYNGASGNVVMNVSCNGSNCFAADMGVQGGLSGRDGQLDNNDFIVFINNFFNHTGCP